MGKRTMTDRDDDARHFRALERIAHRLAEIDPEDDGNVTRAQRDRLLALREIHRAHLGLLDDSDERAALTDWRCDESDSALARARRACGLPAEGAVDWQAVRERVSRLPAWERSVIFDD